MNGERLMQELERDEGRVLKPYEDTTGHITIGVGRNLSALGISDAECDLLLVNDVERVLAALDDKVPWWRSLDEDRQRVLANLAFNVGVEDHMPGGKLLTFTNFLKHLMAGEYALAAQHMLASKWAGQVGVRAVRLAARMRGSAPGTGVA